jgi:secreted PhoX family phosphatase
MDDGLLRPGLPDGMGAFGGPRGTTVLVCNHEISSNAAELGPFGKDYSRLGRVDRSKIYDFREGNHLHLGGTTTLVYDHGAGRLLSQYLSLVGTDRNCSGGPTPWGSWVTCEEPENTTRGSVAQQHGFAFEVPARTTPGLVTPVPLKAMGRFRREAVAFEPVSGAVYQTEDRGEGLVFRFLPNQREKLAAGGRLQALVVEGSHGCDTRNWGEAGAASVRVGDRMPVRWIDIDDPLSPGDDLRQVYRERGAACFARGEGMWFGDGAVYFCCTNGGAKKNGQVWRYFPSPHEGTTREAEAPAVLELFLESESTDLIEMCDNLTVAPWGDLVLCEDGSGEQFVRGVTRDGRVYNLARNAASRAEFCGACFALHHPVLFLNIQSPGLTLAVTGPWAARGRQGTLAGRG